MLPLPCSTSLVVFAALLRRTVSCGRLLCVGAFGRSGCDFWLASVWLACELLTELIMNG